MNRKFPQNSPRNRSVHVFDGGLIKSPQMIVPTYKVGASGKVECVPVPECQRQTMAYDAKSCEISALMYGKMPEDLAVIDVFDQMDRAERITSECVRRFGTLEKQRQSYVENLKNSEK